MRHSIAQISKDKSQTEATRGANTVKYKIGI